ncbi:hypothetical protein BC830DRAFT_736353 [Chytriomyces sp. MP71]|nr:hypothetical protein BC830DRAFT_736353 [Chytriomyces sp. MP71]
MQAGADRLVNWLSGVGKNKILDSFTESTAAAHRLASSVTSALLTRVSSSALKVESLFSAPLSTKLVASSLAIALLPPLLVLAFLLISTKTDSVPVLSEFVPVTLGPRVAIETKNQPRTQRSLLHASILPVNRHPPRPCAPKSLTKKFSRNVSSGMATASTSLAINQQKALADQAYRTISAGLSLDEEGKDLAAALDLYRRGVLELKAALRVVFATQAEM